MVVPTNPKQGEKFRLADWRTAWLKDAFGPGVKEAALSIARRNGKSFLIAVVLLAHLCGPMRRPNWRAAVVSLTGKLATELREAVRQIADASGLAGQIEVRTSPVPGYILGRDGSRVDILAADKSSGHAIGIDLGVCDETGLLENAQLYNSLLSATGGRDGRVFSISIRGDSEIFERIRERRESEAVHWTEYCGEPDVDLQDDAALDAAIKAANPGIADGIKSLAHVRTLAERAKVHPTSQDAMDFRAQGSHDVRAAQRAIMDGKVRTADLLTLRSAIRESEIRRDRAGNPALEKSRQRGRINNVPSPNTGQLEFRSLSKMRSNVSQSLRSQSANFARQIELLPNALVLAVPYRASAWITTLPTNTSTACPKWRPICCGSSSPAGWTN